MNSPLLKFWGALLLKSFADGEIVGQSPGGFPSCFGFAPKVVRERETVIEGPEGFPSYFIGGVAARSADGVVQVETFMASG